MKSALNPHLPGLIAGFRRLAIDCRESMGLYPGAMERSDSTIRLLSSMESAIDLLELALPVPLVVARGASGVGKTAFLNSICDQSLGEPSWKRPATMEVIGRITAGWASFTGVASLVGGTRVLPELPESVFAGLVDTPDVDHLNENSRTVVHGWTKVADLVVWISTPQRFQDDAGERWAAVNGLLDCPLVFVLSHFDECVDGESEATLRAWSMDLANTGFGNPVVFTIQGDAAKIREWLGSELNPEVLSRIRLARLAKISMRLAGELKSFWDYQSRMDLPEVRSEWRTEIRVEADHLAEVVMEGLDVRRFEMEAFLEADLHARLRGIMAFWLKYVARVRSGNGLLTGGWRAILGQVAWGIRDQSARRDQATRLALEPAIDGSQADKRREDLSVRLRSILLSRGLSLEAVESLFALPANANWREQLLAQARTVLEEFENKRLSSGGIRGLVREAVVGMANYLPPLCLLAVLSWPVILFFDPMGWKRTPQWIDLFIPAACLVLVLVGIQALLGLVMPFQWSTIRAELKQRLQAAKANEMEREYLGLLDDGFAKLEQGLSSARGMFARTRELVKSATVVAEESPLVPRIFRVGAKR